MPTGTSVVDICDNLGFCSGVERVIALAQGFFDHNEKHDLFVTGDIVHNPSVMDSLESRGLKRIVPGLLPANQTILLQAHGIPPELENALRLRGNRIIDGLCPILKHNFEGFKKTAEDGYHFFLFGDSRHPEIEAIKGILKDTEVFSTIDELRNLLRSSSAGRKIALISQSTKPVKEYKESASLIIDHLVPSQLFQMHFSICEWTIRREEEIALKAPNYSCVLIVGGKHSANTKKLFSIAQEKCKRVFWINNPQEAQTLKEDIRHYPSILIGGGTSTPISDIVDIKALFL
jgi:(E)-4-hydroxy-3-methyl-but-2-enyl pyrophosphate reductase